MDWPQYKDHLAKAGLKDKDQNFLKYVFEFAQRTHEGEKRLSGEEFITHPVQVSLKLLALGSDRASIAAGLLHDAAECDPGALPEIRKKFGEEVAFLVDGVTKVDKVKARGAKRELESIRKMFLAVAEDIRVVLVKLMDRLHNMETLSFLSKEKQTEISRETLNLYAPLAERLGMWNVMARLEDLSMRYLLPKEYRETEEEIKKRIPEREKYLKKMIPLLREELTAEKINPVEISYRTKHAYSTWKKLERYDGNWERVLDLLASRIIVKDLKECYAVLGIIHKLWKPVPGGFTDYIALPKQNGYKSLHTKVFGPEKAIIEFQIRTPEMHREAESGIAAHWAYSEAGKPKRGFSAIGKKFNWIGQLQEWQNEFTKTRSSSEELLESLKIDFFEDRIFVLTPKGDVIDLPKGSTALDFAYRIHSEIGNHASGAKINGKLVSFSKELASGEVVEIITQKNKKPSPEWLSTVKTAMAKNRIRRALRLAPKKSFLSPEDKPTELRIYGKNRVGFIKDVSDVFARLKINIQGMNAERAGSEEAPIRVTFVPKNKNEAAKIIKRLSEIKGVSKINVAGKNS